ncbi:MAG: substrate-binding domain-containing protein [Bacteroidia bacterium]
MNRTNEFFCLTVFAFFIITACNNNTQKEYTDTATTGTIKISVDETFERIIDGELDTFHALYKHATVIPSYTSETQAFQDLINDTARIIIVTRMLNVNEMKYFEGRKLTPRVTKIARDAIAFIVNNDNPDTILNMDHIQQIFTGGIKNWSELSKENKLGDVTIVFDNKNSSTARYVKENITGGKDFPPNCFAVDSNAQVIEYVHEHKNAIGVIGVNWISDGDDPSVLAFLDKIKTIAIVAPDTSAGFGKSYKPYQAYIATNYYPYTRDVYIISREARTGLGSGFAAFVAGEKGQRIILKSGIMPATQSVRIVGFRNNN